MTPGGTPPGGAPARREDDEALLAQCLERLPELGPAGVSEVCGGDEARAARLRARLAALDRLGLLSESGSAGRPLFIGRYRILDFLGQGGMGAVYLGVDEQSGREVALKIGHAPFGALGPAAAGTNGAGGQGEPAARARARFEREIRAVARLQHPGIVEVYDVGESEGRPYFTMELVEGATLARIVEVLRERRLPFEQISSATLREIVAAEAPLRSGAAAPEQGESAWGATYVETVCRWTIAIAEALDHAHEHSIVHRDVKPSNVMLRRDGRPQLFDLGLARVGDQPSLTRSGDLAGSPFYMSPEQVAGAPERVDRRTDVYSLGVTLFELLTLRRPFEGPTSAHVFRQIAGREPPLLRRLNPLVPRDLETICLAALEKDPERRYASMQELAADLRRFLSFRPVRARPVGAARRAVRFVRRNRALASAVLLSGLVLLGLPIGLLWANAAIRGEERRAAREALLKSRVTDFLIDQFRLTEAERVHGATISARELLERGVERLEGEFEDDPLVRAALLSATGEVYRNLGLYERAIPLLDRALAIQQSQAEADAATLAGLLNELAGAHLAVGHAETARRLCERGLELSAAGPEAGGAQAAALQRTLAASARAMGRLDEAEASLARALILLRALDGADELDAAAVLEGLGTLALERGKRERARADLTEALEIQRAAWAPDVGAIARLLEGLARLDEQEGDAARAAARRGEAEGYAAAAGRAPAVPRLPFDLERPGRAEYERRFQVGITALQSREYGAAIQAFERALEVDPRRPACAYNIACGHALSGDVERGLEWLQRAAELGFGAAESRLRVAETDPEIEGLRADPRGRAILAGMLRSAERARAFAAEPALYRPSALPPGGPWPLFVVLHAEGRTKLDVAGGAWRRLADEQRFALLAPSGRIPTAAEPEQGMTWLEDPSGLAREEAVCVREVGETVRAFLAGHGVDRERIWIAGEGLGAAVAFEVALRTPGLFKGVLLVDGPIHPDTSLEHARRAAALGLRVAYVAVEAADLVPEIEAWLEAVGFREARVVSAAAEPGADRAALLHSALSSLVR